VLRLEGPPLRRPVRGAFALGAQIERWRAVLVKLTTDDGLVGWGTPGCGDTPLLESWIKPQLVGQDPSSSSATPASSSAPAPATASRSRSGT
jgi:L-alanine-DL-glutamate epimerase-like enolase superfamily enzyme